VVSSSRDLVAPYHVLFVHPYPHEGGPTSLLRNLLAHLDQERVLSSVVLLPGTTFEDSLRCPGIRRVYALPGLQTMPRSINPRVWKRYLSQALVALKELKGIIDQERVDLVHTMSEGTLVGGLVARRAGVGAVTHVLGMSIGSPAWIGRIMTWGLSQTADTVIAVSQAVYCMLRRLGMSERKLAVIPNGIDCCKFCPDWPRMKLRSKLALPEDALVVGMVGGLDRRKGHEYFIEACARVQTRIPNVFFLVVGADVAADLAGMAPGTSAYARWLVSHSQQLGLNGKLIFTGFVEDIRDAIAAIDVLVQPSVTEACALAPLEAMAMGRPVVATGVGGNPEEVQHGITGLIAPTRNSEALAEAIIRLLTNHDQRTAMGIAGREWVARHFNVRQNALLVAEQYEALIGGRSRIHPHVHTM
jgi:glycosyltransferase involved in cell wall biosynthesis